MKKNFRSMSILLGFLTILMVQSCKKDEDVSIDTTNWIKVLSVTPSTGLEDGKLTDFEVTISYNLSSLETGTLMIGFNNDDNYLSSIMISNANKIIDKGNGQYVFKVSTTVKNWGTQSDFHVYVNLSENPIPPNSWIPLASTQFVLIPKQ